MVNDIFPGASLVQLLEWGYPMGQLRPTPPANLAFSVVHITANVASAQNEAAWRLNDPALQNSATFFVNQDGSVVQALGDPLHMDPWTNGDLQNPDTSNPRIAALGGVNPNERSLLTIENIGREPGMPISAAQEATDAAIIAYYHAKAGLPVSRETVIGHYQINSVNRANCPSTNKSVIDRIVALAAGQGGDMAPGTKPVSAFIGTFAFNGPGHLLLSPSDTVNVRYTQTSNPGPFNVAAIYDLKDPATGAAIDIDGKSPPLNGRDRVALVDGPGFGAQAYVLLKDGVFTATPSGDVKAAYNKGLADAKAAVEAVPPK